MAQEEFNFRRILPIAIIIGAIILIIVFWSRMTITIDAGHGGILFRTFAGGVKVDKTYGEGFHLLAPWNKMIVYDVRQREIAETMNVLSSNGLEINVDVSAWYRPKYEELPNLHQNIGTDYLQRIVVPSMRSAARSVIGRYTPEQIYSTKRDAIQDEIFEETKAILEVKHVLLVRVLIRSVTLPPTIKEAIESKLQQEQLALEYEFKLQRALQEAERQRIEAEGKAAANRILSESLTDKILRDKGIEATLKLADSPNSKIVIIGNSEDGLPLILGDIK